MSALLNKRLNNVEWGEYRIGDLFDVKKGKRLTKANMRPGAIRYIGATALNNGETAQISNNEHIHSKNTITVTYNGSVGQAFYQPDEFWASDDVNVLYPKFELNERNALFLCSSIKQAGQKYSYQYKWTKDKMKNSFITLPQTPDGNIDYAFIDSFVAELEADRVAELEAYLRVTGLKNYELTACEQEVLDNFADVEWCEYDLEELFEIKTCPSLDKNAITFESEGYTFVGRTKENYGVQGKISKQIFEPNPENTISVSQVGTITAQYRNTPYYTSQNITKLSHSELNQSRALFICSVLNRWIANAGFNGHNTLSQKALKAHMLQLPTTNNDIAYNYMELFISTVIKLVIKDVVNYADKRIAATHQVIVNSQSKFKLND